MRASDGINVGIDISRSSTTMLISLTRLGCHARIHRTLLYDVCAHLVAIAEVLMV